MEKKLVKPTETPYRECCLGSEGYEIRPNLE